MARIRNKRPSPGGGCTLSSASSQARAAIEHGGKAREYTHQLLRKDNETEPAPLRFTNLGEHRRSLIHRKFQIEAEMKPLKLELKNLKSLSGRFGHRFNPQDMYKIESKVNHLSIEMRQIDDQLADIKGRMEHLNKPTPYRFMDAARLMLPAEIFEQILSVAVSHKQFDANDLPANKEG